STFAAAFCFWFSARALAWSVLAAASAFSATASAASAPVLANSSLRSAAVSGAASFTPRAAEFFVCWSSLVASSASRASVSGRLAGERFGARRRGRDGPRFRDEQRRMGKLDRLRVTRRDDHTRADADFVEQLLRKAKGHPHAAVRGRISGQRTAVQREAVPGD